MRAVTLADMPYRGIHQSGGAMNATRTRNVLAIAAVLALTAAAIAAVALWRDAGAAGGATRGEATAAAAPAPAASQTAVPTGLVRYGPAYRYEKAGWTFLHIEGQPYERGFQNGRLMAPEILRFKQVLQHEMPIETGHDWAYFARAAMTLYQKKSQTEYLQEMKGIADGATSAGVPTTFRDILTLNGEMELLGYWYPGIQSGAYTLGADKEHCSAFIATGSYTKGGKVVMAHNNWDHFDTGQNSKIIIDIQPARGHRLMMQTMPGCIASMTDYFVTDGGLMGTETTIGNFDAYDPKGMPEFYRMRRATQYADTLDEWLATMRKGNNGGYANSWLVADSGTGEIMRFEEGLKYEKVERTKDGYFVGYNAATDVTIINFECGGDGSMYDVRTPSGARRVRLAQLMEQYKGSIDVAAGQAILADHYDVYLEQADNPCSRTVDGHYDVDPFQYWQARRPYSPQGSVDGKVCDSDTARQMTFTARWGRSCGAPFDAGAFLEAHPQWDYLRGYLDDRPTQPWVSFTAGAQP
jgi:hypothetical protein